MSERHDTIRFRHASARGPWWILVDLSDATLAWRDGAPCALTNDERVRVEALARAVRAEDASLQPSHVTYAQDESLEIVLGDTPVVIDASNGEITVGPPGALVEAMHAMVRARRDAAAR
ncbi:MAG: hypothetical protein K1X94_26515 [Sandaracinaceae bacterium]|nr:hypothetical protein [Sandaracinaceae bacterium]